MDADACFQLGYIKATHGLKGEVQVVLDVDDPSSYQNLESMFLDLTGQGTLVPFFIEQSRDQGNKMVVKFEEIPDQQRAKDLVGKAIYLPLHMLPPLTGSSFYFHEIVGCQVEDLQRGVLGIISGIYDQGPQILLGMSYVGEEVLIPFNEDIIQSFDRGSSLLKVNLPQGLLEVYLDSHNKDEN